MSPRQVLNVSWIWLIMYTTSALCWSIVPADGTGRIEGPQRADLLPQQLDLVPAGQLLVSCSQEMVLGRESICHIRISYKDIEELIKELPPGNSTTLKPILVSSVMRVRVTGEPAFVSKALNSEQQFIGPNGFTEWSFVITPARVGKSPLYVTVVAVLHTPSGQELSKDGPVTVELVRVQASIWQRFRGFVAHNWQGLIAAAAAIIGAVLAIIEFRRRRKPKPQPPKPTKVKLFSGPISCGNCERKDPEDKIVA